MPTYPEPFPELPRYATAQHVADHLALFAQDGLPPFTTTEQIRAVLIGAAGAWVCGSAFYANFLPTFSQRISELIAAGAPIERSRCDRPNHHHRGQIGQYRWRP